MKLWFVSRRAPLQRGSKSVRVWRTVAMAETSDEAIALAKGKIPDQSTEEGLVLFLEYFSGTWRAEEIEDGKIDIDTRSALATEDERKELRERIARADARYAARRK